MYSTVVSRQQEDVEKSTKKSAIFSSSITRDIRADDFNNDYNGERAFFHKYHGGKVRHIKSYIPVHMNEEKPDNAVIVAGGNDICTWKSTTLEVANDIIEAGVICKREGALKVFISSILPRTDLYYLRRRNEINKLLVNLCDVNGFNFINNDNINIREHIFDDGVHLNKAGSKLLRDNLLAHLNA